MRLKLRQLPEQVQLVFPGNGVGPEGRNEDPLGRGGVGISGIHKGRQADGIAQTQEEVRGNRQ